MEQKARKKRVATEAQIKTWKENDEKIRAVLRLGFKSFREVARKTGLDKRTVKDHITKIPESEFYEEKGTKFLKPPRRAVEKESNFPPELDALTRGLNFPHIYRPGQREAGAIFFFAVPNSPVRIRETAFFPIVEPYETEFLSRNPYWLRDIFKQALREQLIDERYFTGEKNIEEISNEELDNLWKGLFLDVKQFMLVFSLNMEKLLERLKTTDGKDDLKKALPGDVRREFYEEALRLWQQRKPLLERLGLQTSKTVSE